MNDTQVRLFEIMNDCDKVDIDKVFSWLNGLDCKYLAVKHDMDLPRTPHYHIFVKLQNARTISDIARFTGVKEQYINFVKSWKNALAYAFHRTKKSEDDGKYRYDAKSVVGLLGVDLGEVFDIAEAYEEKDEHNESVKELLYNYGDCKISKTELLRRLTARDFGNYGRLYETMKKLRVERVRDREMKVIYITGASGSGKTTLAKYFGEINNYDVFISGSGADVLDGYDKEECIVLDDLRADVFKKAELFKLTDNNTNSSVKSRFKNKDISYCKLMIITSVKTPQTLYNWSNNDFGDRDEDETFKQFARRLGGVYLKIEDNGMITENLYDTDYSGRVVKKNLAPFNMNQVFAVKGIQKQLGDDLMKAIYTRVQKDIEDKTSVDTENTLNVDTENEGLPF